jgi:hypothetical protein
VFLLASCFDSKSDAPETEADGCSDEDLDGDGLSACDEEEMGTDPESEDSDDDGLTDAEEAELGTNPMEEDSDGDGLTDAEEIDCVSDPMNGDEQCYVCGWEHNDPDNLESTGSSVDDVMDDFQLVDQCGEMVNIWDFYGEYHILYTTAAW